MKKVKDYIIKHKYETLICCIFIIGFLIRIIGITKYPAGFNQDEASAGYDAYSILKCGIDRHGKVYPIHFISWGSGQNVLYSYLMIPFIAIFGLTKFAVRLPMAIVGCISLIITYKLLKRHNKNLAIIGLAILAICPWHIMKSRWGLESNLFPDMILWALYFIIIGIQEKKIRHYYIGIIIMSLSVYSYGTSYMFLPIFILMMLIYLLKRKKIDIKTAIITIIICGIIALPMMLFVIINTLDLNEMKIGFITIPRVYKNRYQEVATILTPKFLSSIYENLKYNLKILIYQTDGTNYNSMPFFGIIYIASLPFMLYGMLKTLKKTKTSKKKERVTLTIDDIEIKLLNYWFITSMLLTAICTEANINRLNIIMIPLIFYTILGIYYITKNDANIIKAIITMYTIIFILFGTNYLQTQNKKNTSFAVGLKEPLEYVEKLDVKRVYIVRDFPQPYIYTLFYTKTDVNVFIDTVKYKAEKVAFEDILSFGKYYFDIPNDLNEENVAYLVKSDYKYDSDKLKETKFGKYKVLEPK